MSDASTSLPHSFIRVSRISLLLAVASFIYLAFGFSHGSRTILNGSPVCPAGTAFISFESFPQSNERLTWDEVNYGSATFLTIQRGVGNPGWAVRIQPWVTLVYLGIAALIAIAPRITYKLSMRSTASAIERR